MSGPGRFAGMTQCGTGRCLSSIGPLATILVRDFLHPAAIRPKRTAGAYNKWLNTDRLVDGRIVAKRRRVQLGPIYMGSTEKWADCSYEAPPAMHEEEGRA